MLQRLKKFFNLTYYTSDLDQFLSRYRREHGHLSASQRTEKKKYDRIFKLRDKAVTEPAEKTLWSKFWPMQRLINLILPFLLIGIALGAFVLGIVLLAYLFLFGAFIGLTLLIIAWVKQTFFPRKTPVKPTQKQTGRIIDSDEWNKL